MKLTDDQVLEILKANASKNQAGIAEPILPLFYKGDGSLNRARIVGLPAYTLTEQEKSDILATTLTLQFSSPDPANQDALSRIISAGIRKETRSEISHIDIEMPGGTLIGAHIADGIQERAADYQKWGLRIRVTVPVSEDQQQKVYAYARQMIGTVYDVQAIIGIATGDARLHDAAKTICSSFGALAMDEYAGIVRIAKDKWQVSPEELRLVVTAIPGAVEERI